MRASAHPSASIQPFSSPEGLPRTRIYPFRSIPEGLQGIIYVIVNDGKLTSPMGSPRIYYACCQRKRKNQ